MQGASPPLPPFMTERSNYCYVYSEAGEEAVTLVSVPGTFWWAGVCTKKDAVSWLGRYTCACKPSPQPLILLHYASELGIFWARFVDGGHVCSSSSPCSFLRPTGVEDVKVNFIQRGRRMGLVGLWWRFTAYRASTPVCWEGCLGALPCPGNYLFPTEYLYRIGNSLVKSLKNSWPLIKLPLFSSDTEAYFCNQTQSLRPSCWLGCHINYSFFGSSSFIAILHQLLKQKSLLKGGCWLHSGSYSHKISPALSRLPLAGVESALLKSNRGRTLTSEDLTLATFERRGQNISFPTYHFRFGVRPVVSCCLRFYLEGGVLHDKACFKGCSEQVLSVSLRSHRLPLVLKGSPLLLAYPCKIYEGRGDGLLLRVELRKSFFIFLSAGAA